MDGMSLGQTLTEAFVPGAAYYNLGFAAEAEGRYLAAFGWHTAGHLELLGTLATAGVGGVLVAATRGATVAARGITAGTSMLARASETAFRAAGRADDFVPGAKHAAGAGGRWAKFAEGVNPNAALREALSSPGARFLPNGEGSFRVVTDLGRVVGSRGETGIRAVVDYQGNVITWFPVRP